MFSLNPSVCKDEAKPTYLNNHFESIYSWWEMHNSTFFFSQNCSYKRNSDFKELYERLWIIMKRWFMLEESTDSVKVQFRTTFFKSKIHIYKICSVSCDYVEKIIYITLVNYLTHLIYILVECLLTNNNKLIGVFERKIRVR